MNDPDYDPAFDENFAGALIEARKERDEALAAVERLRAEILKLREVPDGPPPGEGWTPPNTIGGTWCRVGADGRYEIWPKPEDRSPLDLWRSEALAWRVHDAAMTVRIGEVCRERNDALAAVERVKALHMAALSGDRANPVCVHDVQPWPCPTIRALEQP